MIYPPAMQLYDTIGRTYAEYRRPDPRIAAHIMAALGDAKSVVNVGAHPHDCTDGFLQAYWRRPEAYLDSSIRAGISALVLLDQAVVTRGVARLRSDLDSGVWDERFGHLRKADVLDVGYRLVIAS